MDKRKKGTFALEDRITTCIGWIHSVLLFCGLYLLTASFLKMDDKEGFRYFLHCLWLLVPIVTSWFYIRKIKGLAFYVLACMGTWAVTLFASRCLLTAVISIFIFVIRCSPRMIRGRMMEESPGDVVQIEIWQIPTILDEPRSIQWSVFLVFYVVLIVLERFTFMEWMFYLHLADIILTYTYSSFDEMKMFVSKNRRIANLPVNVMQRMQRAMFCITMFLLTICILPALLYGEEPLKRLADIESVQNTSAAVMPAQEASMDNGMMEMLEALAQEHHRELPEWIQKLIELSSYVVVIIVFLVILWLLYHALRHMMQSFAQGQGTDEVILIDSSGNEIYGKARIRKRSGDTRNINRKIRKEYRKTILKKSSSRPAGSETPQELEESAGVFAGTKQAFHNIYEKARYSGTVCTAEELEQFRNAQKEKQH